ncbi:MAG: MCE family protein [Planctomycetes bacterium]|nr:MCE family protein [Planctomycetota bacterium]
MDRLRYLLGLLVLGLAAVGGFALFRHLRSEDPAGLVPIVVEFKDVRGLKPGADVRSRGVTVGSVREVRLSEDGRRGVVRVVFEPRTAHLLRSNTRFWIVSPRFGGLARGASGLDTLIKDSYVAFVTGEAAGAPLPPGSTVLGLERPPAEEAEAQLAPLQRGDLVMSLLVPENHGLEAGARVVFRGVPVGDVRGVQLAGGGTFVEVQLRVDRTHRATVTDRTRFWIARPRLSGALFSGIDVQDVGALLGPYVAYHTEPGEGVPVADGHRAAAAVERPEFRLPEVPGAALRRPEGSAPQDKAGLRLVRVVYGARQRHWWRSDVDVRREGTGVLYEDRAGRTVALVPRSLCDGFWFVRGTFGTRADLADETLRVQLDDGTVLRAGRTWVDPDGGDLALLVVEDPPPGTGTTPAALLAFAAAVPALPLRALALDGEGKTRGPEAIEKAEALPALDAWRGAAVLRDGVVVAIVAQQGQTDTPALVPLAALPEEVRPRP